MFGSKGSSPKGTLPQRKMCLLQKKQKFDSFHRIKMHITKNFFNLYLKNCLALKFIKTKRLLEMIVHKCTL